MAILEKEIWVGLGAKAKKHFEELGYNIPNVKDKWGNVAVPKGTKILVNVEDLPLNSNVLVTKICDYCPDDNKSMISLKYCDVMKNRVDGKDRCYKCSIDYRVNSRLNNVKYEKSAEYYCKEKNILHVIDLFSLKNSKKLCEISYGSKNIHIWNCLKYGEYHEHEMAVAEKIKSPYGCPYCSNQRVLVGYNDMWTTNPNVAKLLWDIQDGYKFTSRSSQKANFKCPDCGFKISNRLISNITKQGLSCPKCSDGVSYPEKFITNILYQFDIEFETQKIFDWFPNKKYDFYIPSLNCIIEAHGGQHYNNGFFKEVENQKDNDKNKRNAAKDNGIQLYLEIDCSESDIDYIKASILESKLVDYLPLEDVDWFKCHSYACSSLLRYACELWSNGINDTKRIAQIIKRSRACAIGYLNRGAKLGLCDYNAKEEAIKGRIKNTTPNSRPIVKLTRQGEYLEEYSGISEASATLNLNYKNIWRACNTTQLTSGFRWMYKDEYKKHFTGGIKK